MSKMPFDTVSVLKNLNKWHYKHAINELNLYGQNETFRGPRCGGLAHSNKTLGKRTQHQLVCWSRDISFRRVYNKSDASLKSRSALCERVSFFNNFIFIDF
ncbi:hypothetical protein VNO77_01501 [Canavalia gladiata]|uniref:Uncharacterized protein n=1 Tax=Canavalia gladiata TaxID=3824 RepID=A0AAN9R276_CANGL